MQALVQLFSFVLQWRTAFPLGASEWAWLWIERVPTGPQWHWGWGMA
jgi:hypothetical protein